MDIEMDSVSFALQIVKITEELGRFLSVEDLKRCRLVSQNWEDWSTPIFREKSTVRLNYLEYRDIVSTNINEDQEHCHLPPFTKFSFEDPTVKAHRFQMALFKKYAPIMTYLKVNIFRIWSESEMESLKDILYRDAPNLKTLLLKQVISGAGSSFDFDGLAEMNLRLPGITQPNLTKLVLYNSFVFKNNRKMGQVLGELVQLYPGLKHLRLDEMFKTRDCDFRYNFDNYNDEKYTMYCYRHLEHVLRPLIQVRQDNLKLFALKSLEIIMASKHEETSIAVSFYEALQDLDFPLETFTLDIGKETAEQLFSDLIALYAKTLKTLVLYRPADAHSFVNGFPIGMKFQSLRILHIPASMSSTMSFLRWTPNLEVLHVCGEDKNWEIDRYYYMDPEEHIRHSSIIGNTDRHEMDEISLKGLTYFRFDFDCEEWEIRMLAKWMPNLEQLVFPSLSGVEDKVGTICEQWPNLKELALRVKYDYEDSTNIPIKELITDKLKELRKLVLLNFKIDVEGRHLGSYREWCLHGWIGSRNVIRFDEESNYRELFL